MADEPIRTLDDQCKRVPHEEASVHPAPPEHEDDGPGTDTRADAPTCAVTGGRPEMPPARQRRRRRRRGVGQRLRIETRCRRMRARRRRREVRGSMARLARREIERTGSIRAAARAMGMPVQSLRDILREVDLEATPHAMHGDGVRTRRRSAGRPRGEPDAPTREAIHESLRATPGVISVRDLKRRFPDVSRRRLDHMRRTHVRRRRRHTEHLVWLLPGATWTADYTEPDTRIDGRCRYVLCVRDLASGMLLMTAPVERADAATTVQAFQTLFGLHGPPLVLKTDNGSHFKGELPGLLCRQGVTHLLSPPYTPRYNGTIEATIGMLAGLQRQIMTDDGRSGPLTSVDIEAARQLANHRKTPAGTFQPPGATDTLRESRPDGLSAEERWRQRTPISDEQRTAFRTLLEDALARDTAEVIGRRLAGPGLISSHPSTREARPCMQPPEAPRESPSVPATMTPHTPELNHTDRAAVARRAIRRTLIAFGALYTWRLADMET